MFRRSTVPARFAASGLSSSPPSTHRRVNCLRGIPCPAPISANSSARASGGTISTNWIGASASCSSISRARWPKNRRATSRKRRGLGDRSELGKTVHPGQGGAGHVAADANLDGAGNGRIRGWSCHSSLPLLVDRGGLYRASDHSGDGRQLSAIGALAGVVVVTRARRHPTLAVHDAAKSSPASRRRQAHVTSMTRRQWSLGPHSSGPLRARTRTESTMFRDAKT